MQKVYELIDALRWDLWGDVWLATLSGGSAVSVRGWVAGSTQSPGDRAYVWGADWGSARSGTQHISVTWFRFLMFINIREIGTDYWHHLYTSHWLYPHLIYSVKFSWCGRHYYPYFVVEKMHHNWQSHGARIETQILSSSQELLFNHGLAVGVKWAFWGVESIVIQRENWDEEALFVHLYRTEHIICGT